MSQRRTKLLCGTCGSTGSIFVAEGVPDAVCTDCNGVGYEEVVHEDARTLDQRRAQAQQGALKRFTLLVSACIAAAFSYFYARQLDNIALGLCFVGCTIASYVVLRLGPIAAVLRPIMNLLKVLFGFAALLLFIAVVSYLIYCGRSYMGW